MAAHARERLAAPVALDVVGAAIAIEWRRKLTRHWPHEIRRDDHDELGFLALELCRAEQRAEDRQIAENRGLVDTVAARVLEQAGNHERLTGSELDGCFGASGDKAWYRVAAERDAARWIELANFRADAHRNAAVAKDDRGESEADAILLVLDGDCRTRPARLRDRDREFATGKEARCFA